MQKILIGLFDTYGQAEAAVSDLEVAGIVGEQVEVISDVDQDARAEELGAKPRESFRDRIAHIFGRSAKHEELEVHDAPGEMPNYIGEQEFYANHVRDEGAIMIVRVANDHLAHLAEAILNKHGSKTRDGKNGVMNREEDDQPGVRVSQAKTASP